MRKLGVLTAAAALAAVLGFGGTAWADFPSPICDAVKPDHAACHALLVAQEIVITKTLLSGPKDDSTADIDAVGSQTLVEGSNDAGAIWIGLDESQHYIFEIKITNDTGSTLNDTVASDLVPAEFDLDPGAHEDASDGSLNDSCTDGTCDGTTDGDPELEKPGFESDSGACVVTHSQPDSASKPEPPPKQPEFFTIVIDGLADEAMCTITIYVKTDENPGGGASPDFEPTSCRQLATIDHDDNGGTDEIPVNDTLTLNEGVKVFQIEPANDLPAHGERQFGPVSSLQLTVNGCDADDDGVQDLEDACPLTGPEADQIDPDGDGCWVDPA